MTALIMRYVFCAAGIAIVALALRMLLSDARNARSLRKDEYETGRIAALVSSNGRDKYNLIREGTAGSSRSADIVLKGQGIEGIHFYYRVAGGMLHIWPLDGKISVKKNDSMDSFFRIRNGESFFAGKQSYSFEIYRPQAEPASPAGKRVYGDR